MVRCGALWCGVVRCGAVWYGVVRLCVCCAFVVRLLCGCCAVVVRLLCGCCAVVVRLLCGCCAVVVRLLCGCCAVVVRLLCGCCAVVVRLLCGCCAVVVRLLCGCCAVVVRLLCACARVRVAQPITKPEGQKLIPDSAVDTVNVISKKGFTSTSIIEKSSANEETRLIRTRDLCEVLITCPKPVCSCLASCTTFMPMPLGKCLSCSKQEPTTTNTTPAVSHCFRVIQAGPPPQ